MGRIAFHFGVHCTDEDSLVRCLLKNRDTLVREGIAVPGPGRYRPLIRKALETLQGAPAPPETEREMLASIVDQDNATRLVLSSESFLCPPQGALGKGMLYPMAEEKTPWFDRLFPGSQSAYFLAIRNLASLLPMLLARPNAPSYAALVTETDPLRLSWADLVRRIRAANPEIPLTVWCDEDTPLIWPEVLRRVCGHSAETRLDHLDDRLATLLSEEGLRQLHAHLAAHPPDDETARREAVSAFLERFARPEALQVEVDVPGWDASHIAALTERYEADIKAIAAMDDVAFIRP